MNFAERMKNIETDKDQEEKVLKLTTRQLEDKNLAKEQLDKISKLEKWGDKKIKERLKEKC